MLFIICFPTIVDSFYILLEIMEYIYIYYIIPLNIFELISVFSIVGSLVFFAAEPAKEHDLEGLLDLLRVVKVLGDELPQRKGRPSPTWYPNQSDATMSICQKVNPKQKDTHGLFQLQEEQHVRPHSWCNGRSNSSRQDQFFHWWA